MIDQDDIHEESRCAEADALSWEEVENRAVGQLPIPALVERPIIAERVFLTLARRWSLLAGRTSPADSLPAAADTCGLACLLLAVEWGREFTSVAFREMEKNLEQVARRRDVTWFDELIWSLCLCANSAVPFCEQDAVKDLTINLDHQNSSIRCWMMQIAWFVTHWIDPVEAMPSLLKNVADTLVGVTMAAGLAGRIYGDDVDKFMEYARKSNPPANFANQYNDRLGCIEESGIAACQAVFLKLEIGVRKLIEQSSLPFHSASEISLSTSQATKEEGLSNANT